MNDERAKRKLSAILSADVKFHVSTMNMVKIKIVKVTTAKTINEWMIQ